MPTEEENKTSFRRYIEEVWNQTNLEVVDEIFDRYISHQPDGLTLERGPEDVKRFVGEFRSAFPDLRISIEEQIAEGDKVMVRATLRGTHHREFRGMAPTGKGVSSGPVRYAHLEGSLRHCSFSCLARTKLRRIFRQGVRVGGSAICFSRPTPFCASFLGS